MIKQSERVPQALMSLVEEPLEKALYTLGSPERINLSISQRANLPLLEKSGLNKTFHPLRCKLACEKLRRPTRMRGAPEFTLISRSNDDLV